MKRNASSFSTAKPWYRPRYLRLKANGDTESKPTDGQTRTAAVRADGCLAIQERLNLKYNDICASAFRQRISKADMPNLVPIQTV
jgi:hypothetical protein